MHFFISLTSAAAHRTSLFVALAAASGRSASISTSQRKFRQKKQQGELNSSDDFNLANWKAHIRHGNLVYFTHNTFSLHLSCSLSFFPHHTFFEFFFLFIGLCEKWLNKLNSTIFLVLAQLHRRRKFARPTILRLRLSAFQLLQLQDDIRRQCKIDGNDPENDVESHLRQNRETLMPSLWKLNVVDIEITLVHVCQMVLQESHARKEELKIRTVALKILGKVYQKLMQSAGSSKKKIASADEDDNSSDSSDDEDSPRPLNYRTTLVTQGIDRLFRCLCNPAFDVVDDEIVYRGRWEYGRVVICGIS